MDRMVDDDNMHADAVFEDREKNVGMELCILVPGKLHD